MWEIFMPLMAKECIAFQNGEEGKRRRRVYDSHFTYNAMQYYYEGLTVVSIQFIVYM